MEGHAKCTHVQVPSATLTYITRTVATQLATNSIIIFLLLNGCLLLCPHRLRHMRPRSIGLKTSLLANTKLSNVEQNTHMAMPLRCRACPNIADNPPLPQPCKDVLDPCTIKAMHIMILLLVFTQSFPTNIRYSGVQAALIGAVMHTYFKIEKLPGCLQRTTLIPNHNIRGGYQHRVTYPYYIPKIVHSHRYLINMACILGIEKDIQQISTHRAYGHVDSKMCYEIREVGIMVVRRKSLLPPYLIHHRISTRFGYEIHFTYAHHPKNQKEIDEHNGPNWGFVGENTSI